MISKSDDPTLAPKAPGRLKKVLLAISTDARLSFAPEA